MLALAGVAAVLAGCGTVATTTGTCTLFQRSSRMYFVRQYDGSATQIQQNCAAFATRLSAGAQGTRSWVVSTQDPSTAGDVLACQAGGMVSLYARPGDGYARALCTDLLSPNARNVTEVLRFAPAPSTLVYVVLKGPPAETLYLGRLFLKAWPGQRQIVGKPGGTTDCRSQARVVNVIVDSARKSAAAPFCALMASIGN